MQRSRKRARNTPYVVQTATRRPIDKRIVFVLKNSISDTQVATTLITCTFPFTITGLRWALEFHAGSVAANTLSWAIVRVKDGNSASNISQADAGSFYSPEQEVLAFGHVYVQDNDAGTGPANHRIEGSTKTMRRVANGDLIQFICKGLTTSALGTVSGPIQFFAKS